MASLPKIPILTIGFSKSTPGDWEYKSSYAALLIGFSLVHISPFDIFNGTALMDFYIVGTDQHFCTETR